MARPEEGPGLEDETRDEPFGLDETSRKWSSWMVLRSECRGRPNAEAQ